MQLSLGLRRLVRGFDRIRDGPAGDERPLRLGEEPNSNVELGLGEFRKTECDFCSGPLVSHSPEIGRPLTGLVAVASEPADAC